ncbi:MAG: DUF3696 domain-containing protein [Bacteroidetes bacterium]|nr:DUF3696 domain-containing protein [Bacteroidota bacterium]
MAHINYFGVENFRVFKDFQQFNFKPITILTGTNSSGKSSLTKALMLLKSIDFRVNYDYLEDRLLSEQIRFSDLDIKNYHDLFKINFSSITKLYSYNRYILENFDEYHRINILNETKKDISAEEYDFLEDFGVFYDPSTSQQEKFALEKIQYYSFENGISTFKFSAETGKMYISNIYSPKENIEFLFGFYNSPLFKYTACAANDLQNISLEKLDFAKEIKEIRVDRLMKRYHRNKYFDKYGTIFAHPDLEKAFIKPEVQKYYYDQLREYAKFICESKELDNKSQIPEFEEGIYLNDTQTMSHDHCMEQWNTLSNFEIPIHIFEDQSLNNILKQVFNILSFKDYQDDAKSEFNKKTIEDSVTMTTDYFLIKDEIPYPDNYKSNLEQVKHIFKESALMQLILESENPIIPESCNEDPCKSFFGPIKDKPFEELFQLTTKFLGVALDIPSRILNSIDYIPSIRNLVKRDYHIVHENDYFSKLLLKVTHTPFCDESRLFLNKYLKQFEIADGIKIDELENGSNSISLIKNDENINLADFGYGISQLFPILLRIAHYINLSYPRLEESSCILIIEEPETNLHPGLQSKLAEMFIDCYKNYNIQFILETHSEYLIRKLQYLTAKKEISPEETQIYYFYPPDDVPEGENQIYPINILEDGSLSKNFGKGFFDEADNIALELFLLKNHQSN